MNDYFIFAISNLQIRNDFTLKGVSIKTIIYYREGLILFVDKTSKIESTFECSQFFIQ